MFNWSGNKGSFKGQIPFYGKTGIEFYTERKVSLLHLGKVQFELTVQTTTSLWPEGDALGNKATVHMPQLH
jgi:malonate-semialdehyde dehydrogenase (acetylating)/methylmalonate-semialdehyde dehydrogenase